MSLLYMDGFGLMISSSGVKVKIEDIFIAFLNL